MFFVVRTGLSENKALENPVLYHHFPHLNRNFGGCTTTTRCSNRLLFAGAVNGSKPGWEMCPLPGQNHGMGMGFQTLAVQNLDLSYEML